MYASLFAFDPRWKPIGMSCHAVNLDLGVIFFFAVPSSVCRCYWLASVHRWTRRDRSFTG